MFKHLFHLPFTVVIFKAITVSFKLFFFFEDKKFNLMSDFDGFPSFKYNVKIALMPRYNIMGGLYFIQILNVPLLNSTWHLLLFHEKKKITTHHET